MKLYAYMYFLIIFCLVVTITQHGPISSIFFEEIGSKCPSCEILSFLCLVSASLKEGQYMLCIFLHPTKYSSWWLIPSRTENYPSLFLKSNSVKLARSSLWILLRKEMELLSRYIVTIFGSRLLICILYFLFSIRGFMLAVNMQIDYIGTVKDAENLLQRTLSEYRFNFTSLTFFVVAN